MIIKYRNTMGALYKYVYIMIVKYRNTMGALYKYVYIMIVKYRNTISSSALFTFKTRNLDIIMMKMKLKDETK